MILNTAKNMLPYPTNNFSGGGCMAGHVYYHAPAKRCYVAIPFNGIEEKFWKININSNWIPIWDKKTGEKLLSIMQHEIDKGTFDPRTFRPNSPLSIKEFSKIWLDNSGACKNTKKVYRHAINKVMACEDFGEDFDIRSFTFTKLQAFKNSLQLSDDAKYNVLSALKTMLNVYKKDVPSFVLPVFPPLTKPEPEKTEYLTFDEQQRILDAIPERHRPIFILMMEYGLRPQEATALKWDCISESKIIFRRSHSEYELRETTKTGKKGVRSEDITTRTRQALKDAKQWPSFQGWVFCHNQNGSHYDNKILNKIWHAACAQSGVKIELYEGVRHSFGSQLMDMGYDIDFVRDAMSHTSSRTTRRYAHRNRSLITNALENRGKVVEFRSSLEGQNKNASN
jgi:integrase